jgi:hypothetical protein
VTRATRAQVRQQTACDKARGALTGSDKAALDRALKLAGC